MGRIIDADSHFMEPLDLWERYIEPQYRSRCLRFEREPQSGRHVMVINEGSKGLGTFDFTTAFNNTLEDMDKRVQFLDQEGIACQFIYPTLGLLWEGQVSDPELAAAHCRAYNTWTLDVCAGHRDRLYPVGHISLRHPQEAVRELERLAKAGYGRSLLERCPLTARALAVLTSILSGQQRKGSIWPSAFTWSCIAII